MMRNYVVVGFGSAGRIALSAVRAARAEGIKVGLFRPITVSPFPTSAGKGTMLPVQKASWSLK